MNQGFVMGFGCVVEYTCIHIVSHGSYESR